MIADDSLICQLKLTSLFKKKHRQETFITKKEEKKQNRMNPTWSNLRSSSFESAPPPLLPLRAQLDVPSGGQGGSRSLKLLLTISLPSQLIYSSPSPTPLYLPSPSHTPPPPHAPTNSHPSPPSQHPLLHPPAHTHSLVLSVPSLFISIPLTFGVKTLAARSAGDKSDPPGRVIVKHPTGRLRPPHPFNSSAGMAAERSREGPPCCGITT